MERFCFKGGEKEFIAVIAASWNENENKFKTTPFMANPFLYYYENEWLLYTKKRNLKRANRFGNLLRFIDDLLSVNGHLKFHKKL